MSHNSSERKPDPVYYRVNGRLMSSKSDKSKNSLKIIGQNICKIRKERNLSQKALAKKIGIKDPSYISRLEKGQQNATIKTLEKISDALSVELDDLLPLSIPTVRKIGDDCTAGSIINQFCELSELNARKAKAVAEYIAYLGGVRSKEIPKDMPPSLE